MAQVIVDNRLKSGYAPSLMDTGANLCLHLAPEGLDPWIASGTSLGEAHAHDRLKQYPLKPPVAGVDAILTAVQYRSLNVLLDVLRSDACAGGVDDERHRWPE